MYLVNGPVGDRRDALEEVGLQRLVVDGFDRRFVHEALVPLPPSWAVAGAFS